MDERQKESWKIRPDNPLLYRMIRWQLLEPILSQGTISCPNLNTIERYHAYPLAKPNMISKRATTPVSVDPFGSLHDYVAFYFAPRSPMLYSIYARNQEGVNCEQSDIIYLVTDLNRLKAENCQLVVTDGNAVTGYTKFESKNIDDFVKNNIDWEVMQAIYWNIKDKSKNNYEYGRWVRHAECLVYKQLSVKSLIGIAVMDNLLKETLEIIISKCGYSMPVLVKEKWYF
jgi:hypothetical protein